MSSKRRSVCSRCWDPWRSVDCTCTGHSRKRRHLREHRATLRDLDDTIHHLRLGFDLQACLRQEGISLEFDPDLDGESDTDDDPEQVAEQLRAELQDQSQFIAAVQGALENGAVVAALEHARMQAEDFRAQLMRQC